VKRIVLCALLLSVSAITFSAPPKSKKPAGDYSSWNDKWFATCQGDSFIVDVKVGSPKSAGSHSFDAYFLEGGGICSIGKDAPVKRFQFLHGTMSNGKISGTILLCTQSQELVDANQVPSAFGRHFDASYDPKNANITDTKYKGEHYVKYDSATQDGGSARRSAGSTNKPYQRDEPGDPEGAFEMHLWRPGYDQPTHHEASPDRSETPPKLGDKARDAVNDVVHDGVHEWMNELRKMLGADPI
jgi:hypothetical protein